MRDGAEFRAGTMLTNEFSLLAMVEMQPSGAADAYVTWDSVSGKLYQVEFKAGANYRDTNTAFTAVNGVIAATGPTAGTLVTNGLVVPGHFRVRLVEP